MKKHRLNGALHSKTLELDLQNDLNMYIWTQKQITWYCFPFHADNKDRTTPTSWAKPWLGVVCGGRTWAGLGISGTTSGFLVSEGRPATVAWARLPKLEIHSYPNTQKMEKIFFFSLCFFFQIVCLRQTWQKYEKLKEQYSCVCCHVELTLLFAFSVVQSLLCLLCGAVCGALLHLLACPPAEQNYINVMKTKTDIWGRVTTDFCVMWLTAAAGDGSCAGSTWGAISVAVAGFASGSLGWFDTATDLRATLF